MNWFARSLPFLVIGAWAALMLAAAYLRCYTEGDGTVVTSQLARHVGRSPDWVRRALPEVHRVCRDVLADAFGIRGLGDVT